MRRAQKTCAICESGVRVVDWKDERTLTRFLTERGKILPSRLSGACSRHQRQIAYFRVQATDPATNPSSVVWDARWHRGYLYVIDNEIHHRGQGYVYLRALGIEPPSRPVTVTSSESILSFGLSLVWWSSAGLRWRS